MRASFEEHWEQRCWIKPLLESVRINDRRLPRWWMVAKAGDTAIIIMAKGSKELRPCPYPVSCHSDHPLAGSKQRCERNEVARKGACQ